jgi:aspartokinase-like uncharacterized kinase
VTRPLVIKVGGSLLDWPGLPLRLASFLEDHRADRPVMIVGGGRVADVVRDLDRIHRLGEERAHALALRALDLSAQVLAGLLPGLAVVDDPSAFEATWSARLFPILTPRRLLETLDALSSDPLPHCWEITTDSIAARIAVLLGAAGLILLKSAPVPPGTTRTDAARLGLVDPAFPEIARPLASVVYLNLRDPGGMPIALADEGVIGPGRSVPGP